MKSGKIFLYHVFPILLVMFPFLYVALGGSQHQMNGELGFIELSTVVILFVAIGFCVAAIRQVRRLAHTPYLKAWLLVLIAGAAYFALEEMSYGQHLFGWSTPEGLRELNYQEETNLHNVHAICDRVPRALLTLGILVGGVILPLYRQFRGQPLSESNRFYWQWPTMDCVTIGLLVILIRPFFTLFEQDAILVGELKEQFFALFILLYCISLQRRIQLKVSVRAGG